jgi:membrane protease YdiL (CAAX protease family)
LNLDLKRYPAELTPRFAAALLITLSMAIAYTVLDVLQPSEPLQSALAFIPGIVAVAALLGVGLTRADIKLRFARLSLAGGLVLAANTLLMLPILLINSTFVGWSWLPALLYAPASGIAQELFFRASLLPALERALPGRPLAALFVHSAIFVGFHYRTFASVPSLPPAIIVAAVLFLGGCAWGWQVQRDGTILWAMIQHSLFLAVMSMFTWS